MSWLHAHAATLRGQAEQGVPHAVRASCLLISPILKVPVAALQNAEGAGLGPFDCWLALRGLKTMALRMERQAATATIWRAGWPRTRW